jgi:hypothetical protein
MAGGRVGWLIGVRARLTAGGRRIRTIGPSRKGSAGKVESLDEVSPSSRGTGGSNPSSSSSESGTNRCRVSRQSRGLYPAPVLDSARSDEAHGDLPHRRRDPREPFDHPAFPVLKLSVKSHWISRLPSLSPLRIFPSKRQVARKPIRHPLVKAISRDDSDGVTWLRPDHVVTAAGRPGLAAGRTGPLQHGARADACRRGRQAAQSGA